MKNIKIDGIYFENASMKTTYTKGMVVINSNCAFCLEGELKIGLGICSKVISEFEWNSKDLLF